MGNVMGHSHSDLLHDVSGEPNVDGELPALEAVIIQYWKSEVKREVEF
jgi:hypothetical protein